MSTSVTFNGSNHSIPAVGERNYGLNVSNYLIAIAAGTLQRSGGSQPLTADLNLGSNYGLVSKYFKSVSANIAQSGVVRLSNNEGVAWRNAANGADKVLKVDASDKLAFGSSAVSEAEFGHLSGVTSSIQTQINNCATDADLSNHVNAPSGAHAASAISNTPSGNLAAIDVQSALNELQFDIDARATSAALSSHTGASSGIHGVTGSVVGTSDIQTLTNKTINGANNTLTVRLANDVSGTLPIANGGTGQASKTNAFDALSPTTTKGDVVAHNGTNNVRVPVGSNGQVLTADSAESAGIKWTSPLTNPMSAVGDIIVGGASGAATRLAGNTSTARRFLRQTGNGSASATPAWDALIAGDLPAANTSAQGAVTRESPWSGSGTSLSYPGGGANGNSFAGGTLHIQRTGSGYHIYVIASMNISAAATRTLYPLQNTSFTWPAGVPAPLPGGGGSYVYGGGSVEDSGGQGIGCSAKLTFGATSVAIRFDFIWPAGAATNTGANVAACFFIPMS